MQSSRSFPCLLELLDVSPYEKTFNNASLAQDSVLFDHNYAGWTTIPTLQSGYKLIRRNSLPFQEYPLIRRNYQCIGRENPILFMNQCGRPMLQRRVRRRFMPYERTAGDKLPVLPVDEVERILRDIENGTYENTKSSESKESASREGMQYFRSVSHYSTKEEDSSHYQMMSSDEELPNFKYAKDSDGSPDFNFDIVEC